MPFRERWPEQALQVMKEDMLAEVASPAIPPGLQLRTKQEEKIQTRVQSRDGRVLTLEDDRSPVFGLVCVLLSPAFRFLHSSPSAAPAVSTPQWTTFVATAALVVVDGSTTIYYNSPADAIRSEECIQIYPHTH